MFGKWSVAVGYDHVLFYLIVHDRNALKFTRGNHKSEQCTEQDNAREKDKGMGDLKLLEFLIHRGSRSGFITFPLNVRNVTSV